MADHRTATPNGTDEPKHTLPQWEISRRQRLALDERIHGLRRWLLSAGLVGTAAFTLLAGYQTQATAAPNPGTAGTTAIATTGNQTASTSFFSGQGNAVSGATTTTNPTTAGSATTSSSLSPFTSTTRTRTRSS